MASMLKLSVIGLLLGVLIYLVIPIPNFNPNPSPLARFIDNSPNLYDDKSLDSVTVMMSDTLKYPEDLDVDESTGAIYTGLSDGTLLKIEGGEIIKLAQGKDIVLGVKLSKDRRYLYFADTGAGICRLDLSSRNIEVLTSGYNGVKFRLPNSLDIAADGKIFFTDTSTKFTFHEFFLEFLQSRPNGRLFVYDPSTRTTELLLDSLYFPNGIAISHDNSFVVFAQTSAFRLSKYFLTGSMKGMYRPIIGNLPGAADNVKLNKDGKLWVGLPAFKSKLSDKLSQFRIARIILAKMPDFIKRRILIERPYAGGMLIDLNTESIVKILRTSSGKVFGVATILEKAGKLYFSSITDPQIGVIPIPK